MADDAPDEATDTGSDDPVIEQFGQTIPGVEILRVGTWNGRKFTSRSIDDLVNAASEIGYRAPVVLGHGAAQDAPAYGYATNLRRKGDVLVADFADVPDDMVKLIKDKRFDQVSSEVFFDLSRDGKKYPHALRAVALLGAHPPAVSNLKPISSLLSQEDLGTYSSDVPHLDLDRFTIPKETPIMSDAEIAKLQADLKSANEARAAAEAKAAEEATRVAKLEQAAGEAPTLQLRLQEFQEGLAAAQAQLAEEAEDRRQLRISTLVQSFNIPALRPYIQALAELSVQADRKPRLVLFRAAGSDAASETDAYGVLDQMVKKLNSLSASVFGESVANGTIDRRTARGTVDDPSQELFAAVGEYIQAHPGTNPDVARSAILSDPKHADLRQRWNNAAAVN